MDALPPQCTRCGCGSMQAHRSTAGHRARGEKHGKRSDTNQVVRSPTPSTARAGFLLGRWPTSPPAPVGGECGWLLPALPSEVGEDLLPAGAAGGGSVGRIGSGLADGVERDAGGVGVGDLRMADAAGKPMTRCSNGTATTR
jgi:hypothetical protein